MFKHYLKAGFRVLLKYKRQTLISVIGLAIGFTCFALSMLWIRYEMTFDRFHPDSERIYMVRSGELSYQNEAYYPFASFLKETFPEVEAATSVVKIVYRETDGRERTVLKVSLDFFDVFQVDFLSGSKQAFLNDPQHAVVSEREAKRCFGDSVALGHLYQVNIQRTQYTRPALYMWYTWQDDINMPVQYTIGSIAKSWIPHSDLQFDYLVALPDKGWKRANTQLFVKLRKGTDVEAFQSKIRTAAMPNEKMEEVKESLTLQPLQSLHLSDVTWGQGGNLKFNQIVLFAIAGFMTILCLLFNYISLFISRMQHWSRELALRLALGSGYGKLYTQLSIEFILILFLAFLVGFVLIEWLMPHFVGFANIHISIGDIYLELFLYILLVMLLSWLLSVIPLIKIRNNSGLAIFRGGSRGRAHNYFQHLLLTFQLIVGISG